MKNLKFLVTFIAVLLISVSAFSQTDTEKNQPSATVTFKSGTLRVNPVIEFVNQLTANDAEMTEMVMFQLHQLHPGKIVAIVPDEEFNTFSEEQKRDVVRESDVLEIINNLK